MQSDDDDAEERKKTACKFFSFLRLKRGISRITLVSVAQIAPTIRPNFRNPFVMGMMVLYPADVMFTVQASRNVLANN